MTVQNSITLRNSDSSSQWIVRFRTTDAELLGAVRLGRGLQVLVDGESLWLRGGSLEPAMYRRILSIPDVEWFVILPDEQLTRRDETVPLARLPLGEWQPLEVWLELELPRAGFAARTSDHVMLKLVRSSAPIQSNLLLATWEDWSAYATTAPQVRLNRLAFAVSDKMSVLIRGTPIPPIPGRSFMESNGIVVPNGWRFDPQVGMEIVRHVIKLNDFEMALFSDDGSFERLPESAFVRATRSAVRATRG